MANINDVTLPMEKIEVKTLLSKWTWLIGEEKLPIAVSKTGDAFVQSTDTGEVFYLDVDQGKLEFIAIDGQTFMKRLGDGQFILTYFKIKWFMQLKKAGLSLQENQVYSWRVPLALGGQHAKENIQTIDAVDHFFQMGQIMEQVANTPEGEPLNMRIVRKVDKSNQSDRRLE